LPAPAVPGYDPLPMSAHPTGRKTAIDLHDGAAVRRAGYDTSVRRAGGAAPTCRAGDPRSDFFLFTAGPRRAGP
jgi:hypothetical protein